MDERRGVIRLSIALCRPEADLLSSAQSGFIQSVAQATHNLFHAQSAARAKRHSYQYFPFQMELPGLLCVRRNRFVEDFDGSCAGLVLRMGFMRRSRGGHRAETS